MEKIDADDIFVAYHEGRMNLSNEFYRSDEVDAALASKQTEVNNAMEFLFKEQRRYDALLADVRVLVEFVKKLIEPAAEHIDCDCMHCKAGQAIAAVERHLHDEKLQPK